MLACSLSGWRHSRHPSLEGSLVGHLELRWLSASARETPEDGSGRAPMAPENTGVCEGMGAHCFARAKLSAPVISLVPDRILLVQLLDITFASSCTVDTTGSMLH